MAAVVALMTAAVLLTGCQDARVYDHYEPVSDGGWERNDTLRFTIPRQLKGHYEVNLGLRFNHLYPYRDLSLIVSYTTYPPGSVVSDTVLVHLVNEEGRPFGKVGVTSATLTARIKELSLHNGDSIYVTVHHNMRRDQLPGINDVGVQLVKK